MENNDFLKYEAFTDDTFDKELNELKIIIEEEVKKISDTNKILPKEIRVIFRDYKGEETIREIQEQQTRLMTQYIELSRSFRQSYKENIDAMWEKVNRKINDNSEEHLIELENKIKELETQIEQLSAENVGLNEENERLKEENANIKGKTLVDYIKTKFTGDEKPGENDD